MQSVLKKRLWASKSAGTKVYKKVEMSTTKNLVFSFMYLVSLYPMGRTYLTSTVVLWLLPVCKNTVGGFRLCCIRDPIINGRNIPIKRSNPDIP